MGMFCVPDPRQLGVASEMGMFWSVCVCVCPRSSVTGSCLRHEACFKVKVSRSPATGSCLRNRHVLCPRSSVTGSCLRYGHVLCPRSPATGSCLRHVVYIWARSRQPVYFWGWAVIQRFRQATQSCLVSWGVKSIYF